MKKRRTYGENDESNGELRRCWKQQ